jgi:DNA-binding beta-propeller fold protein YncE
VFALTINLHGATGEAPLVPVETTPLPAITGGDFDHFAFDLKHDRLYVSAEVYGSIEVFSLKSGVHLLSAKGVVKSPHKLIFVPDSNELFVADADDASCKIIDAVDLHLIKRIPLEQGPDSGVYDPTSRIFYVGNGGHSAGSGTSYISAISIDQQKVIGRIPVEAGTLKTMVIDNKLHRLYVNMRDKQRIGVIDLKSKQLLTTWPGEGLNLNSAMALDANHQRLFVGSRRPGKLFVFDTINGEVVDKLDIVDVSDDMTYDASNRRLYISGADGVDVISQIDSNRYQPIQHVDTLGGKTSVYVPSLKRFYVVHTKGEKAQEAGLQVFAVNHQ